MGHGAGPPPYRLRHVAVHVNVYLPIDGLLISVRREIELANSTEKSKRPFNVTVPCLYEKYMEAKSFLRQGAWKITEPY